MSQIDFSKAPEGATHYLQAKRSEDIAWFRLVVSACYRWFPEEGSSFNGWASITCLPPLSEAIPAVVDWSKGPADATHYLPEIPPHCACWIKPGHVMTLGAGEWHTGTMDAFKHQFVDRPVAAGIDWSRAPGATHWNPKNGSFYRGEPGDVQKLLSNGRWVVSMFEYMPSDFIPYPMQTAESEATCAPVAPQWDGQGLPPVGIVCEYKSGHISNTYSECEIIAHFQGATQMVAAYIHDSDSDKIVGQGIANAFRPIRTPEQIAAEQIAAEERDKAVSAMWTVLNARLPERYRTFDGEALRSALGILHDQGYRKPDPAGGILGALESWLPHVVAANPPIRAGLVEEIEAAIAKLRGEL